MPSVRLKPTAKSCRSSGVIIITAKGTVAYASSAVGLGWSEIACQ
jgi:hypothetical protein